MTKLVIGHYGHPLQHFPAELAELSLLRELEVRENPIQSGFEYLPQQLERLGLYDCKLRRVPAALAALTQLT